MEKIKKFREHYWFLSNFSFSPIEFAGQKWPTAEHFFQALKTTDPAERERIRRVERPSEAKRLGRHVALKSHWNEKRNLHMFFVLRLKFKQNLDLAQKLLATGDAILEEGNHHHDNYWGNCLCFHCKDIKGENHLGKLLMQVREELKNETFMANCGTL